MFGIGVNLIYISVNSQLNSLFLNHKHGEIFWFLPEFSFAFLSSVPQIFHLLCPLFMEKRPKGDGDDSKPRHLTKDEIKNVFNVCVYLRG